jgi:hypothetical protein
LNDDLPLRHRFVWGVLVLVIAGLIGILEPGGALVDPHLRVMRLEANGALDTAFGTTGVTDVPFAGLVIFDHFTPARLFPVRLAGAGAGAGAAPAGRAADPGGGLPAAGGRLAGRQAGGTAGDDPDAVHRERGPRPADGHRLRVPRDVVAAETDGCC